MVTKVLDSISVQFNLNPGAHMVGQLRGRIMVTKVLGSIPGQVNASCS